MFLSLTAQTNQFTFFMNGVSGSNPVWVSSQLGWFNFYNFLSIAGGLLYGASADYVSARSPPDADSRLLPAAPPVHRGHPGRGRYVYHIAVLHC